MPTERESQAEGLSGPGDRERLLDEVGRHVADRERAAGARRPPRARRAGHIVAALLAAQAAALAWTVWHVKNPSPISTPERLGAAVDASVFAIVRGIELYRERHGRLPASLAETIEDESDAHYERRGESDYVVTVELHGVRRVYRSGDDLAPFAELLPLLPTVR